MGAIPAKQADTPKSPIVREYDIKGTRFIVSSTIKAEAKQDAAAIVRRLIRNEINGKLFAN